LKPMDVNDPITSDLAQSYLKMSEIINEVPEVIEA